MNDTDFEQAFAELFAWCRQHKFAGHDPFDALNSKLFQITPFRHSPTARLLWTQTFKRSPVDFRKLAQVPAERNSKGVALFTLAALANYRRTKTAEAELEARNLLRDLQSLQLPGCRGAAWGYNFDWQSRVFFAPRGTPTIVPTAFAARAFVEAAHAFRDDSYLEVAHNVCHFILRELPRSVETGTEVCFSYTPHSKTRIFNASLLAAETLARVGALCGSEELCSLAVRAARYVVNQQREDGSWAYGADASQTWVDNFHTAYLLSSLHRIIESCEAAQTDEFRESLQRGYEFWRDRFFLADGWAKYYHDTLYPVDTHAAATAIASFLDLTELDRNALPKAEQIAAWSINNMRDRRGFFYYQRRRFYVARTPFMRWTQAWMLYALARLLEERQARVV